MRGTSRCDDLSYLTPEDWAYLTAVAGEVSHDQAEALINNFSRPENYVDFHYAGPYSGYKSGYHRGIRRVSTPGSAGARFCEFGWMFPDEKTMYLTTHGTFFK